MSVWVIRYRYNKPNLVCEDIGDIVSFERLENRRVYAITNTVQEYRISGQMVPSRHSGRAPISVPPPYSMDTNEVIRYDQLTEGYNVDEQTVVKYLKSYETYLKPYCIDSRVLALVSGTVDLVIMHADQSEYDRLYQNIPSKEKAEEYLRASGFTYGKWYTPAELKNFCPRGEWRKRYMKVGAISILID